MFKSHDAHLDDLVMWKVIEGLRNECLNHGKFLISPRNGGNKTRTAFCRPFKDSQSIGKNIVVEAGEN